MARHLRRLTFWFLAGIAALALLALLAWAALWWWFDPDDYRAQIEARASSAIGRQVHLTGALGWQLGWRITIASDGGDIANAAGFGSEPFARWSRIRLGVAARPLLDKRVLIDRIDVEGLQIHLQRNAQGLANWELNAGDDGATNSLALRIASVAMHDSALRYQDAVTGADWRVANLQASAKLPEDLNAPDRKFSDVKVAGRISGEPLAAEGVMFAMQAAALRLSPQQVQLPRFTLNWGDATLAGDVTAQLAGPEVSAKLNLEAPSLRALLATARVTPPLMRDPATLGKLHAGLALHFAAGAATFDELSLTLDDTHLQGTVSVPKIEPFAVRFSLAADRVDLDRYREPADVTSKPLELPLAWLKQLDAKGSLLIRQATIAGAAAKEVRIDVE